MCHATCMGLGHAYHPSILAPSNVAGLSPSHRILLEALLCLLSGHVQGTSNQYGHNEPCISPAERRSPFSPSDARITSAKVRNPIRCFGANLAFGATCSQKCNTVFRKSNLLFGFLQLTHRHITHTSLQNR